jgi:curved DNA-binding protein CbpA
MEYLDSLKHLYGLNQLQMDNIKKTIKVNVFSSNVDSTKTKLDILMKQQSSIKNQIPGDRFNNVSNFIIEMYSYINDFKSNNLKVNTHVNKVQDLSNYNMDTSILSGRSHEQLNDRLNLPKEEINILGDIDPYKLYGYDKDQKIDLIDLKSKYKKYAMQTHPDKNNGDSTNFNIINESFKVLYEDYKLKQNDKQFTELKNGSQSFIETQTKTNSQNINFSKDNFNVNKFNTLYNDNRIGNAGDEGYGDWSKSTKFDSEDIVRDTGLTNGNFNSMFNKNVKVSDSVVKYTSPKELFMNAENNCEELGVEKIDNYTGKSKSINYTDYKEAHTTSRLVDPNTKYNRYNSINDIKSERSNIKKFSAEEVMNNELEKAKQEESEKIRLQAVSRHDTAHFDNYNKIHNIMINRR